MGPFIMQKTLPGDRYWTKNILLCDTMMTMMTTMMMTLVF